MFIYVCMCVYVRRWRVVRWQPVCVCVRVCVRE